MVNCDSVCLYTKQTIREGHLLANDFLNLSSEYEIWKTLYKGTKSKALYTKCNALQRNQKCSRYKHVQYIPLNLWLEIEDKKEAHEVCVRTEECIDFYEQYF
jgi:hypothetical protein